MKDLSTLASLMRGRNPQSVAMQMIKNNGITDPNIESLVKFAQTGDTNSLVNLADQMFKQNGLDLNREFSSFMNMLK